MKKRDRPGLSTSSMMPRISKVQTLPPSFLSVLDMIGTLSPTFQPNCLDEKTVINAPVRVRISWSICALVAFSSGRTAKNRRSDITMPMGCLGSR
jgi:hypothetical protein